MNKQITKMKEQINSAEVISFDIFDTLIKRIFNSPETVFDVTGRVNGIIDYMSLRQEYQMKASQKAEVEKNIPHADYDDIYDYIAEHGDSSVDWSRVKENELQIEEDCLVRNEEIYGIYRYAVTKGKRVIITSDMYLEKSWVEKVLAKCGYTEYDCIYLSSDVHATKYNGDIFRLVCEREGVEPEKILHIGDNYISDYENAQKYGLSAVNYKPIKLDEKILAENPSPVDKGAAELLMKEDEFWYNLGVYAGGPLYLGLTRWFKKNVQEIGYKRIYFLARDGYNLNNIFENITGYDTEYLYTSRRALLLAGITELDEDSLEILPPFTFGQTVREVLQYIDVEDICAKSISDAGLPGIDYVIKDVSDMQKVRKLYTLNEHEFLKKCEVERNNAKKYFKSVGFFNEDSIVFDCGWNGSSQYLLDRFLDAAGYDKKNYFLYVGIMDTVKSRKQLNNKLHSTYLFNYDNNIVIQNKVKDAIVLFELFFGSPEESVYIYDENGVVFERTGQDASFKEQLCRGIKDFVMMTESIVDKYGIHISRSNAISSIIRLVNKPTEEEAHNIGDLQNVDGFAAQKGLKKYIAKLDEKDYDDNPNIEIYWLQGLLSRDDVDEELKVRVARDRGYDYTSFDEAADVTGAEKNITESPAGKDDYTLWIEENEKNKGHIEALGYMPLFSFVVPVYNVIDTQLIECIESIRNQTYKNWELWLVDDASTWDNVRTTLSKYEKEGQINVIYRKENGHISRATNDGIEKATGEFIAFMDCDDVIAPNALYEFAKKLNENKELDFIYSDEDKLTEDGTKRHSPFFKPDWSPDTFMSIMYTNHLAVYRTELVRKTGGLRTEFNGAQDYDFTLRFMELSDNKRVGHIPKVLYYWRERSESIASNPEAKPYALEAVKNAKKEALERRGLKGTVEYVGDMFQYRVVYENRNNDKVSIVIPSKDNVAMLKRCVESIIKFTKYPNYDIIIIDNGSNTDNRNNIEKFAKEYGIIYHYQEMEFNFSKMCNMGAQISDGKYILFLNDDIEIFNGAWLGKMVGHASLDYVGAVGAKLLYPESNIIQHAGITNLEIGPAHLLMGYSDSPIYYFGRNEMEYNYLAVTAACIILSRDKFMQVGGFDEALTVAYNDVDLCFKLYEAGYYNVLRNDVSMYHHESASRGPDDISEEKKTRLLTERKILYRKHPELKGKDPFYSPNLAINKADYSIKLNRDIPVPGRKAGVFYQKSKMEEKFVLCIDKVEAAREINIIGWYFWKKDYLSNKAKAQIVLRDSYNRCILFDTQKKERKDVANALGNNADNTGFECYIPYADIDLSNTDYQIGVLLTASFNKKVICWTENRLQRISHEYYKSLVDFNEEKLGSSTEFNKKLLFSIDSFDRGTGILKGWALNPRSNYNDLEDFHVEYICEDERYKINVFRYNRPDVAEKYCRLPNVLRCGFETVLPRAHCEKIDAGTFEVVSDR